MLGAIHSVSITEADIDELRTGMLTMPPHPDLPSGLKQLKDAGFRLVTCTNSPPGPQASPLKHAGIDGWFEKSFSVDRVRRFKPAPQVYHMVAEELNVPPGAICMVAAHVWDTIGTQRVGCSAALIARPGNAPLPVHGATSAPGCRAGPLRRGLSNDQALARMSVGPAPGTNEERQ